MKNILLILLLSFTFLQLRAQQHTLQPGDSILLFNSEFNQVKEKYKKDNTRNTTTESYLKKIYTYKLVGFKDSIYTFTFHSQLTKLYSRSKKGYNSSWKSINSYYPEIRTDTTMGRAFQFPKIQFDLSINGIPSNAKIISEINNKSAASKDIIIKKFYDSFVSPLLHINKNTDEQIIINKDTFKQEKETDNYWDLQALNKKTNSFNEQNRIYNKKTGELYNYHNHIKINNNSEEKVDTIESLQEIQILSFDNNPFSCKYHCNNLVKDTTLRKTNTIISGKITNPSPNDSVSISWYEDDPMDYRNHSVKVPLAQDGTFEIRLYLKKQRNIRFIHKEYASLTISTGDSLFITVDMNHFDETIRATGIGGKQANYFFDKFLFLEKEDLSNNSMYPKMGSTVSYDEYKQKVLKFISKRTDFLNDYKSILSPDIYLSEYYETITSAAQYLKSFYDNKDYWAYKTGTNIQIPINDYNETITNLIHPDNDLMSFCENYPRFIREYSFFYLDNQIENMTGKGNTIPSYLTNYYDFLYISRYNHSDTYYTGITQYTLKYKTVEDAIEQGSEDAYKRLYNRFTQEFPDTEYKHKLDEIVVKAENVKVGAKAYDFALQDLNGNTVKLSDFKGTPVYITFSHFDCFEENLKILNDTLKDKKVQIILILKPKDKALSINNIPNFIQLQMSDSDIYLLKDKFFFDSFPHSLLVDVNGNIVNSNAEQIITELIWDPENLNKALNPSSYLTKDEKAIQNLKILLFILGGLMLTGLLIWIIYRRRARRKLRFSELQTKVRELELTAIRAQMNPHFMFNCLNSIQNLIQKNKNEEAHLYISKFAELIRAVLKNSDKEEISLAEELEMIKNYVELEKLRFDIHFEINTEDSIDIYSTFVPPLLLQPIVENAILHGLAPKSEDKNLEIFIKPNMDKICISVTDNGVGRGNTKEKTIITNGKGIKFSKERLNLLSEKLKTEFSLEVFDLKDNNNEALGTKVQICLSEEQ